VLSISVLQSQHTVELWSQHPIGKETLTHLLLIGYIYWLVQGLGFKLVQKDCQISTPCPRVSCNKIKEMPHQHLLVPPPHTPNSKVLCYKKALQNSFIMVNKQPALWKCKKTSCWSLLQKSLYNKSNNKEQVKIEKTKTVKSKLWIC
jgi:hypothetical protein